MSERPGKQKLEELVAKVASFQGWFDVLVTADTIRSISDAYKAMEAECERLRALIAAGDDAHRSIVSESATPSAMKDDLAERCWTRLVGKRTTREQCNVVTIGRDDLTAVLSIARPAILEEAAKVAEPVERRPCDCERCYCGNAGDLESVAAWDQQQAIADRVRALVTTGQEGGRWQS